jgi:hypothetical protein
MVSIWNKINENGNRMCLRNLDRQMERCERIHVLKCHLIPLSEEVHIEENKRIITRPQCPDCWDFVFLIMTSCSPFTRILLFRSNVLPLSSGFKNIRRRNFHGHYGRFQWRRELRPKWDIKPKFRDMFPRNVGTRIQDYRLPEGKSGKQHFTFPSAISTLFSFMRNGKSPLSSTRASTSYTFNYRKLFQLPPFRGFLLLLSSRFV